MTTWEFTYVDLWLSPHDEIRTIPEAKRLIAQLGGAGWEPVGDIVFTHYVERTREVSVRQLMFKRPLAATG